MLYKFVGFYLLSSMGNQLFFTYFMSELDKPCQKYFEESKFDPLNQQYGLFSYSGTLAVSKGLISSQDKHSATKTTLWMQDW